MKIGKLEIFVTIAVILLVITTIMTKINNKFKAQAFRPVPIYINSVEEKELLKDVKNLSKKYQAYEDMYNSDKLTLVYSYFTTTTKSGRDEDFHKELTQKLEDEGIKINTITYKNWEDDTLEIGLKNKEYIDETATCGPGGTEEILLKKYVEDAQLCINNVCLVDAKKNKFFLVSPDVEYVVETIKKYPNIN